MDHNATINFYGAEVNLAEEYHEAAKLKGLVTTDLDELMRTVTHIYLNIPEEQDKWAEAYLALIHEIEYRQAMMMRLKLGIS